MSGRSDVSALRLGTLWNQVCFTVISIFDTTFGPGPVVMSGWILYQEAVIAVLHPHKFISTLFHRPPQGQNRLGNPGTLKIHTALIVKGWPQVPGVCCIYPSCRTSLFFYLLSLNSKSIMYFCLTSNLKAWILAFKKHQNSSKLYVTVSGHKYSLNEISLVLSFHDSLIVCQWACSVKFLF